MDGKKILLLAFLFWTADARAALVELSALVSYGKVDFADGYKSSQRSYSGSIDFKFTQVSALQFEYTDRSTKISSPINVGGALPYYTQEATTYRDKIYSFNWVQNLVSSKWIIQPYFVFGGGKMKRRLTREYPELGLSQSITQNVTNGTAGLGLRIFLTKSMAIKSEMKTYVPKFQFSKWKENQQYSVGLSWVF
jgi:hypothetical protein